MSRRAVREALADVKPTLVDRVVSYFDPVAGAARARARCVLALSGSYTGARRDRRATSEWAHPLGESADAALLADLPTLRSRSRDLARNNPLARGAINTVVTNTVGTGLMLQAQPDADLLGLTPEEAADWQKGTEREFELWSAGCDITRAQDFYGLQDLAFRSTLESGDLFVLTPMAKLVHDVYGLKLQLVEADRVCNESRKMDTALLAGGVELDAHGAPVRYHITTQHPGALHGAGALQWMKVEAFGKQTGRRNVLHLFKRLRPGQSRGEPYLAPVIEPLKQLGTYTEAEIMAAVVSGLFTVFTHTEDGQGLDPAAPGGIGTETGARADDKDVKLGPGTIVDLGMGEKIETANPGRPNQAFDPFVQAVLRQVGVALELPFEILIKHYTASYSAARAAILDAWRFFKVRRAWIAAHFCQPVYELFLVEAVALGRIAAPGFFDDPLVRMAWCRAQWVGDGMGAIDPNREAEAAGKRMELRMTTLASETAEYNGGDWEANLRQQGKEQRTAREAGLTAPVQTPAPGPAAPADPDQPEGPDRDETEDEEDDEADGDALAAVQTEIRDGANRIIEALGALPGPQVNLTVPERETHIHVTRNGATETEILERDGKNLIRRSVTRPVGD